MSYFINNNNYYYLIPQQSIVQKQTREAPQEDRVQKQVVIELQNIANNNVVRKKAIPERYKKLRLWIPPECRVVLCAPENTHIEK